MNWEQQSDHSSVGYEWVIRSENPNHLKAIVWFSDNHGKWMAVSDWDHGRGIAKGPTAQDVMDQVMSHFVQWRIGA